MYIYIIFKINIISYTIELTSLHSQDEWVEELSVSLKYVLKDLP